MIDNQQTVGHRLLIFGLEQKTSTISEYKYRVYSSGCYYLNKENEMERRWLTSGSKNESLSNSLLFDSFNLTHFEFIRHQLT